MTPRTRRRDPGRDRGSADPDGARRRHPDPALSAAGRDGVLRPRDQQAAVGRRRRSELWDHVIALAAFPGFAEIKRSLRERPQLGRASASTPNRLASEEDWHGGSRRLKK